MSFMKRVFIAAALAVALGPVASMQRVDPTGRSVQIPGEVDTLQAEVLISTLPSGELTKQLSAATGTVEHKSEVARGGPVAVVVRAPGCTKDPAGACKANADVVIYKPDGSVFQEAKSFELPAGRGVVPLRIDANAAPGIYKAVVTVRDLAARRFATLERQFGVK
jgi:hypothetical protein